MGAEVVKGNHYWCGSVSTCKSIGLKFAEKSFVFSAEEPEATDCPKRGESDLQGKETHPKRDAGRQGWKTPRAKSSRCSFCTVYGLLRKEEGKLTPFISGLVRGDSRTDRERADPVSGTNLHSQESTGKIKGSLTFKQGSQQDSQTGLVQI